MIAAIGLCPWPPLLARELNGVQSVVPELREACLTVVNRLLDTRPDVLVVVGPWSSTQTWESDKHLDLRVFAPIRANGVASMPASVGMGVYLLDEAGHQGERVLMAVDVDEPMKTCVEIGRTLAQRTDRVALLLMGDGSARRNPKAPGHFDPRAEPFDAAVERALRTADVKALQDVDASLAKDLMATGRVSWQILSGALPPDVTNAEVLYSDDPFGVAYIVAFFAPST